MRQKVIGGWGNLSSGEVMRIRIFPITLYQFRVLYIVNDTLFVRKMAMSISENHPLAL